MSHRHRHREIHHCLHRCHQCMVDWCCECSYEVSAYGHWPWRPGSQPFWFASTYTTPVTSNATQTKAHTHGAADHTGVDTETLTG